MEGIYFVIDGDGNRVAVQLDLAIHASLWEKIHEQLIVESRKRERLSPIKTVARRREGRKR